uniref:Neogenin C-terminal domain-containing protein n=2 Tax=Octopus bimaculoides TaxID=37653 RepID=A0A0L8GV11_OCTBM
MGGEHVPCMVSHEYAVLQPEPRFTDINTTSTNTATSPAAYANTITTTAAANNNNSTTTTITTTTTTTTSAATLPLPNTAVSVTDSNNGFVVPGAGLTQRHPLVSNLNSLKAVSAPGVSLSANQGTGAAAAVPKHLVKPQQSSSPYKRPNPPVSSGPIKPRSPMPIVTPKAPDVTLKSGKEESEMQKSLSTEELTAEMANLEGLMKDLNAITQQEFEC